MKLNRLAFRNLLRNHPHEFVLAILLTLIGIGAVLWSAFGHG